MKISREIKERLENDADWGVYDGILSRKDLVDLMIEFDTLERENQLLKMRQCLKSNSQ